MKIKYKNPKILFITRYDRLGASSRQRLIQYFKYLDVCYSHIYLIDDRQLKERYKSSRYKSINIILSYFKLMAILPFYSLFGYRFVVEKEIFPYLPYSIEKFFCAGAAVTYDYDDPIYLNYQNSNNFFIRKFLGDKISKLMNSCTSVIVGNFVLEEYALKSGAKNVIYIPTVVDENIIQRKRVNCYNQEKKLNIVWIGSPSTYKYLQNIMPAIKEFSKISLVPVKLTVVGANCLDEFQFGNLEIRHYDWDEKTEYSFIQSADVGIMPLVDDDWSRGKCGYKIIQYMSCGIPVIASPVGINSFILRNNVGGILCKNFEDWVDALICLSDNYNIRRSLGESGYLRFQNDFSLRSSLDLFKKSIIS